jgi:hypothetical protein
MAASAIAQQSDPLTAAEQAYTNVDFEAAIRDAQRALERGGNDRARLARIYRILSISRAGMNDADGARQAYIRHLALEPDSHADRGLSPTMRAPLMEARGFFNDHPERMEIVARRVRDGAGVEVALADPVGMVRTIWLRVRVGDHAAWVDVRQPAGAHVTFALPPGASAMSVEYVLRGEDEHGNHVLERGTDEAPERFGGSVARVNDTGSASNGNVALMAVGVTGLIVGALGLIVGGVAVSQREAAVANWNDDSRCLSATMPLATRQQLCGDQLSTINTMQTLEEVGFIAGGALVVGGAVAAFIGWPRGGERSTPAHARFAGCGLGPGSIGARCEIRF